MTEYIVRMPSDMPYEIKAELNAWYVNSEPIVRCSDCKHYIVGTHADRCAFTERYAHPDGFCAWGERRSDAE